MIKYTITIEIENSGNANKDFLNSLFNEVEDEKLQLKNCYKINQETTKIHRQILEDVVRELDKDLSSLGVKFHSIEYGKENNRYKGSKAIITFSNGWSYKLYCRQHLSNKVEGIKYSTYTNKPTFYIERSAYNCYSARDNNNNAIVKKDNILQYMERDIKEHIEKL